MTPVARLLARHRETLADLDPHWLNPPADLAAVFKAPSILAPIFTQDQGVREALTTAGLEPEFGDFPAWRGDQVGHIVFTLPRGKALVDMMISCCADRLAPGGTLWVAGEIRDGIKSVAKRLRSHFKTVEKVDSARHCALLRATGPVNTAGFDPDDWRRRWPLEWHGVHLDIQSWPGVFNHGALDDGTALLLDQLPTLPAGSRVLDFGCGSGVIGACLATRNPGIHVELTDVSALACRASEATLAANDLAGQVLASNGFSALEGPYDLVVTNPPFHEGHRGNAAMTPTLLAPIRNFLAPGGQLLLVANQHLPYESWLRETLGNVRTLTRNNAFKVYASQA